VATTSPTIWYRTRIESGYRFWTYNAAGRQQVTPGDSLVYSLAYVPSIQAGDSIPLGFTTDVAGSFTLRTKESTNMDSLFVDLHDLLTGDIVEDFGLLGAEYGFESESAGAGTSPESARFLLVFRSHTQLPPVDEEEVSTLQIWCDLQNRLHVRNAAGEDLLLYNIQGIPVGRWRVASARETISLRVTQGVYVVRMGAAVKKIIIQ
jgi:hypothetical protein